MEVTYEWLFLKGLAWTLALELPVVVLLFRWGPWRRKLSAVRLVVAGTVPTLLTLPYLWFLGPWIIPDRALRAAVGEPMVALVEAALLCVLTGVSWKGALAVSIAANLCSWLAGCFLPLL
ncbi:MAG: hypothetical protein IPN71_10660 [Fibrobacteres bacterium]|nr:hypothetical protein [Fibrobacterota bacterium]MBK9579745.1 hypothetical protein [Fibrobacterota bacterium]QQS03617.1 MAG: hypothetical protein IPK50_15085 [Fibrobacterota bacterium]